MATGRYLTVGLCACVWLCGLLPPGAGEVLQVEPLAATCTDFNCTSNGSSLLDEALAGIESGTTIVLSAGCHCVQEFNLVQNVNDVAIVGESHGRAIITCAEKVGLAFLQLTNLTIENVTIDGCGLSGSSMVDIRYRLGNITFMVHLIHHNYHIALLCGDCTNLHIRGVEVNNTLGLGFLGVNVMGTSEISNSTFAFNAPMDDIMPFDTSQDDDTGGGAVFLYNDYRPSTTFLDSAFLDSVANLSIRNSFFLNNLYPGYATLTGLYFQYSKGIQDLGYGLGGGGGLTIVLTQVNYSISTTVERCVFRRNRARYGGGAHLETFMYTRDSNVTFSNCLFEHNGQHAQQGGSILNSVNGGGLAFFIDFVRPREYESLIIPTTPDYSHGWTDSLMVRNTTFQNNQAYIGGAVIIESLYSIQDGSSPDMVLFEYSYFYNNTAYLGAAMYVVEDKSSGVQPGVYFLLDHVHMVCNMVYKNDSLLIQSLDLSDSSSIIDAISINITIQDSLFELNTGTVIRTVKSVLNLGGFVTFANNTGTFGGALRLLTFSFLVIKNHSNIVFKNNVAEISGGAIYYYYLNNLPNIVNLDCVLFFDRLDLFCLRTTNCVDISATGATVTFTGNSARTGSIIYGTTLESCPWGEKIQHSGNYTNMTLFEILYHNFSNVFSFDTVPNTVKEVSTASGRVEVKGCHRSEPVDVIPGQVFHMDVVVLDRFSREVQGIVSSTAEGSNVGATLGLSGYWFTSSNTTAPVTIFGGTNQEDVLVTLFTIDSFAQTVIHVNLVDCPEGFIFEENSCVCDPRLEHRSRINCNSTSMELMVDNNLWFGRGPDGEMALANCINDYCEPGPTVINTSDLDVQCNSGYQRTGMVCGACKTGYSTVFGSNRCKKCNNYGLIWIPGLAAAGIIVIFFICFFHFTISRGMLLSIIFYSNILSLYTTTFTQSLSGSSYYYTVNAWLNLDFGIESCFYDGMDPVSRTALGFAFPLYLYLLMLSIVFLARRSQKFSKLFSKHSTSPASLFATLLLLTQSSLTETCVEILGLVRVTTLPDMVEYRWRVDPSEPYFSPYHGTLVAVSILLLIFYIIPAPLLLIFPNCGRRVKLLRRLTPIYDSFWAPFRPWCRFWVGLRLLLRALPLCFADFLSHPDNLISLGVFLLILIYVQTLLWPFKSLFLNVFDLFFQFILLAMVMLSLGFSSFSIMESTEEQGKKYDTAQHVSAIIVSSAAYIAMAIAFIVHIVLRFPKLCSPLHKLWRKARHRTSVTRKPSGVIVSYTSDPSTQTYGATCRSTISQKASGATSDDDKTKLLEDRDSEEGTEPLKRIHFSQLREPLLDEGELSIVDVSCPESPEK